MPEIARKPLADRVRELPAALVAWVRNPFAPSDEADGARVAGYRLVRGPDGYLYAVKEADE